MDTPEALFSALLADRPAQPFVTYYDEATGERSELSAKSMANWVAKTHFLLSDEFGLGPGDLALIALPAHWITVPILLGCWTAGLAVTADPGVGAMVAFVEPATAGLAADVPDVLAVNPGAAAVGFGGTPPEGTEDYVTAVRPQPDKWPTVHPPAGPSDPAIDDLTRGEVVLAARERATALGLTASARVLTTGPWDGPAAWTDALLAPLAVGGSLVLVTHADMDALERRAEQERVTSQI